MITTKWPGLIVLGDSIPEDLALEINVRTMFPISTNAHDYHEQIVGACLGRDIAEEVKADRFRLWDLESAAACAVRALALGYLRNSWVASAWIGGPKGWCRPDGRIACANYNIGKWPSDEEVSDDLAKIAAEWPILRMTVQCLDREHDEDEEGRGPPQVVSQWEVSGGKVELGEPASPLLPTEPFSWLPGEIGIDPMIVLRKCRDLRMRYGG